MKMSRRGGNLRPFPTTNAENSANKQEFCISLLNCFMNPKTNISKGA